MDKLEGAQPSFTFSLLTSRHLDQLSHSYRSASSSSCTPTLPPTLPPLSVAWPLRANAKRPHVGPQHVIQEAQAGAEGQITSPNRQMKQGPDVGLCPEETSAPSAAGCVMSIRVDVTFSAGTSAKTPKGKTWIIIMK
ncbi:hypothetical protein EYF80_004700 [Liparis tanakae]|uniref:Uncharacterized protein n=1 Tax=Liparis tanakae TaxID=230148 RepID=A0A4Z2J4D2_9TELE|nr:hypothetical protein EYF80_004700 [Liparis tanakae]